MEHYTVRFLCGNKWPSSDQVGRSVLQHPDWRSSSFLISVVRKQVNCKAAQPMRAHIVLSAHCAQTRFSMCSRAGRQGWNMRVAWRQSGSDSLQHPGPAEVEAVEMGELRIAGIR